jgi:hypothetical protein
VKAGIPSFDFALRALDSGLRQNDEAIAMFPV